MACRQAAHSALKSLEVDQIQLVSPAYLLEEVLPCPDGDGGEQQVKFIDEAPSDTVDLRVGGGRTKEIRYRAGMIVSGPATGGELAGIVVDEAV